MNTTRSILKELSRKIAGQYDTAIDSGPFKKSDRESLKAGFRDGWATAEKNLLAMLGVTVDEGA